MSRILKFFIFILFLSFVVYFLFKAKPSEEQKLKVGNATLKIEIAGAQEERSRGLSDRKSLCTDCGMLFVFDESAIYSFWMRRMYFDIDILWIRDGEVVDITYGAKAPPKFSLTPPGCQAKNGECINPEWETPKTFYQSKVPVDMVLEVNSGWVKTKGIKVGNKAEMD